jgi:hypothetical protein
MIALICFVLAVLASPFKSKCRLEAENRDRVVQTAAKLVLEPIFEADLRSDIN